MAEQGKIFNPFAGREVSVSGRLGKLIVKAIEESNDTSLPPLEKLTNLNKCTHGSVLPTCKRCAKCDTLAQCLLCSLSGPREALALHIAARHGGQGLGRADIWYGGEIESRLAFYNTHNTLVKTPRSTIPTTRSSRRLRPKT